MHWGGAVGEAAPGTGDCGGGPAVTLPGPWVPGWGVAGAFSDRSGLLCSCWGRRPSALEHAPAQPHGEPRARPVPRAFCASSGRSVSTAQALLRVCAHTFLLGSPATAVSHRVPRCVRPCGAQVSGTDERNWQGRGTEEGLRRKDRDGGLVPGARPGCHRPSVGDDGLRRKMRKYVLLFFAVIFPIATFFNHTNYHTNCKMLVTSLTKTCQAQCFARSMSHVCFGVGPILLSPFSFSGNATLRP